MTIVYKNFGVTGQVGVHPRRVQLIVTDTLATITTANYLQPESLLPSVVYATDIFDCIYNYNKTTKVGTYIELLPTITAGVITLTAAEGNVTLPTIANHIATYTNTTGGLSEDPATAISGGNIQAGLSTGTAGFVASLPGTGSKGALHLTAVANTGNTVTTISNAAMGQASVISIPDPAGATAEFVIAPAALVSGNALKASGTAGLVMDGAYAFHAGTTGAYGGGGTSNAFTVTGMASTWIVTATILSQAGTASIVKAVPSSNTLTVTFSADPGAATTVSWIASTASV